MRSTAAGAGGELPCRARPHLRLARPVSCKRCAMLQSTTALSWMTIRIMLLCCLWERCQTASCRAPYSPGSAGCTPAGLPPGASSEPCAPGQPRHAVMGAAANGIKNSRLSLEDTCRPQSSQHIAFAGLENMSLAGRGSGFQFFVRLEPSNPCPVAQGAEACSPGRDASQPGV